MTDYQLLIAQTEALLEETNKIAALSNVSACINESLSNINWVGFYFVENNELVLGPFQGRVACTHIPLTKGVCGKAVTTQETQVIQNVHEFPGHIACDSASESELVVPIIVNQTVVAVLDIDAPIQNRFNQNDANHFEEVVKNIQKAYSNNNWI